MYFGMHMKVSWRSALRLLVILVILASLALLSLILASLSSLSSLASLAFLLFVDSLGQAGHTPGELVEVHLSIMVLVQKIHGPLQVVRVNLFL